MHADKHTQHNRAQNTHTSQEDKLRRLGFGYRAKYIVAAAKEVLQRNAACGGAGWLAGLRAGVLRPGIAGVYRGRHHQRARMASVSLCPHPCG